MKNFKVCDFYSWFLGGVNFNFRVLVGFGVALISYKFYIFQVVEGAFCFLWFEFSLGCICLILKKANLQVASFIFLFFLFE